MFLSALITLLLFFLLICFFSFLAIQGKHNNKKTLFSFNLIDIKSNGKVTKASWIFEPIRVIFSLMTTMMFIPIVEFLVCVFVCQQYNDKNTNFLYKDIECWGGAHLAIVILNAFNLIIYLVISFTTITLYFESSITTSSCISK